MDHLWSFHFRMLGLLSFWFDLQPGLSMNPRFVDTHIHIPVQKHRHVPVQVPVERPVEVNVIETTEKARMGRHGWCAPWGEAVTVREVFGWGFIVWGPLFHSTHSQIKDSDV